MKPKLNTLVVAEFIAVLRNVRAWSTCRHYEAVLSRWARWADERKQKHPVTREQWEDYWRSETGRFSGVSSWDMAIAAHNLFWKWVGLPSPVVVRFRPRRVRNQRQLLSDNNLKLLLAPERFETAMQQCTRLALRLMASSGCRISEVCALKVTDIDWNEGAAVVVIKRGARGLLRFDAETLADMRAWLKSRRHRKPESPLNVLLTQRGTAYEPNNLRKAIVARAERRGVPGFRPHDLRHRFATVLIANGVPLTTVQRLMNHTSIDATAIYVRTTAGQAESAHAALRLPATKISMISRTKRPAMSDGTKASTDNLPHTPKGAVCGLPGCPPSTDAPVFYNAPVTNWRTE
jgi:integrase/recombinase XerD